MLERYLGDDRRQGIDWESLSQGAPTILGFARLCSEAMSSHSPVSTELMGESKLILHLARERGIFELRGTNDAFDSSERLLTIHIEQEDGVTFALKAKGQPRQAARFLEGLRRLCAAGFVLHHLQREFSLSASGFELAEMIDASDPDVEELLPLAQRDP